MEKGGSSKFLINERVANPKKKHFIDDYTGGAFPFTPRKCKHLFLAVGYEKERDMAIDEVTHVTFKREMIRNNLYAFWTIVYYLGKVLEVRRKNTPYTEGDSLGNIAAEE